MEVPSYFDPDYDPSSLRVVDLRNILTEYQIYYPSTAKKAQLITLFSKLRRAKNGLISMTELQQKNVPPSSRSPRRRVAGVTNNVTARISSKRKINMVDEANDTEISKTSQFEDNVMGMLQDENVQVLNTNTITISEESEFHASKIAKIDSRNEEITHIPFETQTELNAAVVNLDNSMESSFSIVQNLTNKDSSVDTATYDFSAEVGNIVTPASKFLDYDQSYLVNASVSGDPTPVKVLNTTSPKSENPLNQSSFLSFLGENLKPKFTSRSSSVYASPIKSSLNSLECNPSNLLSVRKNFQQSSDSYLKSNKSFDQLNNLVGLSTGNSENFTPENNSFSWTHPKKNSSSPLPQSQSSSIFVEHLNQLYEANASIHRPVNPAFSTNFGLEASNTSTPEKKKFDSQKPDDDSVNEISSDLGLSTTGIDRVEENISLTKDRQPKRPYFSLGSFISLIFSFTKVVNSLWLVLLVVPLLGFVGFWHQEVQRVGFCGVPAEPYPSSLYYLQPGVLRSSIESAYSFAHSLGIEASCQPCPENAECGFNRQLFCKEGLKASFPLLADFGLKPYPRCIPNTVKVNKVEEMVQAFMSIIGKWYYKAPKEFATFESAKNLNGKSFVDNFKDRYYMYKQDIDNVVGLKDFKVYLKTTLNRLYNSKLTRKVLYYLFSPLFTLELWKLRVRGALSKFPTNCLRSVYSHTVSLMKYLTSAVISCWRIYLLIGILAAITGTVVWRIRVYAKKHVVKHGVSVCVSHCIAKLQKTKLKSLTDFSVNPRVEVVQLRSDCFVSGVADDKGLFELVHLPLSIQLEIWEKVVSVLEGMVSVKVWDSERLAKNRAWEWIGVFSDDIAL
ncbi:LEM domain nuclear inner membrane protein Man1, Sad1 interacting factor [Schizosaccharomyces pombe]|uniref:Meiotically up-regulated gene 61 protein n=1 Tax=Schizosaccharomyces pombe (strain 972 / ATCC 24843) TaxID=284812 RepID=MUG61_SCHPO|nr:putative LEM domain-containing protein Man1 [Schizosaccharomyces pombe]O13712.1 RecName: Full=Meiotically up-regulated gene 61 protein [Schizosaccharomyces pombe 972h-]CAB11198.1 LEM domain protein Man1, Sad1 interacting factor (predicted) [Schizosaccharomyces pombe]|eukprot:NP_594910.1 putative LEM domain-containing protein Man1 [Schizosaccharomyces pombe]